MGRKYRLYEVEGSDGVGGWVDMVDIGPGYEAATV